MAMKLKMLKLISEYRGFARITNRRPTPRPPMLYLMQLREESQKASLERRRLIVQAASQATLNTPLPVKINHVKSDEVPMPVVVR